MLIVNKSHRDEELNHIGRLRYKAYINSGLIDPNSQKIFLDRYDNKTNTQNFFVLDDDFIVSALRVHTIDSTAYSSATYDAFEDILYPLIDSGMTIVDGARFVVNPEYGKNHFTVTMKTLSLASHVAKEVSADFGVAAVQINHIKFYERAGNFSLMAKPRKYSGLNTRLALIGVDFSKHPID